EVQCLFSRHAGAAGQLGWIDLTNDVSEFRTWSEPFAVTLLPRPPCNRDLVLRQFREHLLAGPGDRPVRVLMNRGARNVEIWYLLIQKANQRPHQPTLGLSLLAEKEHVVPGDQGQIDLRNHGAVIADDSGEQLVATGKHGEEVVADLMFDR